MSVLVIEEDIALLEATDHDVLQQTPDRYWFGQKPRLLAQHHGKGVDEMIEAVDRAARSYPSSGQ